MSRLRIFTREEIANLLREAASHCKKSVPIKVHKTDGRTRVSRPKKEYLECIGAYIKAKELERLKQLGYAVDASFVNEVKQKASKYHIPLSI